MAHIKMLKIIFKSIPQLGSFIVLKCNKQYPSSDQKIVSFLRHGCWKQVEITAETNMEDLLSHKGKKLKSYNNQFKLDAIKFAQENLNHSASGKFGVAVKRIREWRGNKDQLEKLRQCSNGAKRFRVDRADEKPLAPEMEDVLLVDDKETHHEESPTFT